MTIVDVRPVWALSGGEMLAQLDVLHAEMARLQTRRLELIARIDEVGYAKTIGGVDTVQVLAFRHRLDLPAVGRDLIREAAPVLLDPAR
jgi:acyl-CoA hydrolase